MTDSDLPPKKTVYVLGAGFSMSAGAPSQAGLMEKVINIQKDANNKVINNAKTNLISFLTTSLGLSKHSLKNVELEDIYTPIDRCLAEGLALRDWPNARLSELRADLGLLIAVAIEEEIKNPTNKDKDKYITNFAKYLVKLVKQRANLAANNTPCASAAKAWDPVSIISLNWDTLLDNAIYRSLEEADGEIVDDYAPFGVVDYCCHISSINKDDRRIRSGLWSLGARGYNIKLLKLHGSMNWLQCPICQRMFVGFDDQHTMTKLAGRESCRHCQKSLQVDASTLQSSLVMPTFLKDLSNFQIKLVWQNAGLELQEAKSLVFIGYSLPQADFEFRQLLTRMIPHGIPITVVLPGKDKEAFERYEKFFSGHKVTWEKMLAHEYVGTLTANSST